MFYKLINSVLFKPFVVQYSPKIYLDATRKSLKDGAIPHLNLPVKSITTPKPESRSESSINKRMEAVEVNNSTNVVLYSNLEKLVKSIGRIKVVPWKFSSHLPNYVLLSLSDELHIVPKFEVFIDSSLEVIYICAFAV